MKGCGNKTYWEYPLIPKDDGCCGHFYCGTKYDCDEEPCYCQDCKDKFVLVGEGVA